MRNIHVLQENTYITNDEKIKEGDYLIWNNKVYKDSKRSFTGVDYSQCKKIILTTDQDLGGVQAIDDEFLEWFVNNPSCENVEVEKVECEMWRLVGCDKDIVGCCGKPFEGYKITIPKEEPKQDAINYSLNAFKVPKEYFGEEKVYNNVFHHQTRW